MTHQAKATIIGSVANRDKLRTTPNGFLGLSVRCQTPRRDGGVGNAYYDVKWFAPESHDVAAQFQPGDEVYVVARIAKEKDQGTGSWSIQLVGESCRLVGELGAIADQFDAKPVAELDSDILF